MHTLTMSDPRDANRELEVGYEDDETVVSITDEEGNTLALDAFPADAQRRIVSEVENTIEDILYTAEYNRVNP